MQEKLEKQFLFSFFLYKHKAWTYALITFWVSLNWMSTRILTLESAVPNNPTSLNYYNHFKAFLLPLSTALWHGATRMKNSTELEGLTGQQVKVTTTRSLWIQIQVTNMYLNFNLWNFPFFSVSTNNIYLKMVTFLLWKNYKI